MVTLAVAIVATCTANSTIVETEDVGLLDCVSVEDILFDELCDMEALNEHKEYEDYVVTAYCPCEICCGKSTGVTASGTIAKEGRTIAVDTSLIPYGTEIEIEGVDGIFIAEDCGGAVKGNKLDLFFNSHEKAIEWGRQVRKVYIRRN